MNIYKLLSTNIIIFTNYQDILPIRQLMNYVTKNYLIFL